MVSIIVPVYESEKTLRRCIESLSIQTYRDIEIIMIVDGPSDISGILADNLARWDSRIRVIYQRRQGVSNARNVGMKAARGEYIQFVDSDDYLEIDACEKLVHQMELNHSDLVICGFHHLYFGRDVRKIPKRMGTIEVKSSQTQIMELYRLQFLNMPWNKLYKKEKITEYFSKDFDLGEDLIFNLNYLQNAENITILPEMLCYYLQDDRGTTLSTKKRKNRMENAFKLYEELLEFFRKMYGNEESNGILESRLVIEFLDEMESLAFDKDTSTAEKLSDIEHYFEGYRRISNEHQIQVGKLDYKIILFFFKRQKFRSTYFFILLRGFVVGLIRRL